MFGAIGAAMMSRGAMNFFSSSMKGLSGGKGSKRGKKLRSRKFRW